LGLTIVRVPNAEVSEIRLKEIVQQRKASLGSPLPRQGEGDRG
jgi:hypothetical protein